MATEIKFGTDGFRGVIAKDFTYETLRKITNALCVYLKEGTILVGYDPRFTADKFAQYCAEILCSAGFRVLLSSKVVPTPVIAFNTKIIPGCKGAVMLTASHNPKEYLGVKFIPNYAGPATVEITDAIEKLIKEKKIPAAKNYGSIEKTDFSKDYFSHISELIDFNIIKDANVKFIYDGLYSASIGYFDTILKNYGINFEVYNNHYDSDFGGGLPEPKPMFMKHFKEGYLTFANDGDADRYGVIDEKGNYVCPNIILALLTKYLGEKGKKGKVIKTVGVSKIVDLVAQKLNIETITTPVGFKWLCDAMRKNETLIAGEDSGGLSTGEHIPEKDGIFANLLILQMVSDLKKPLYVLTEEIKEYAGVDFKTDRLDIKLVNNAQKEAIKEKFADIENIASFKIAEILHIDGIKYFLDDNKSWVLMRESGTEPLLRFYIESDNLEKIKMIKSYIMNYMNS